MHMKLPETFIFHKHKGSLYQLQIISIVSSTTSIATLKFGPATSFPIQNSKKDRDRTKFSKNKIVKNKLMEHHSITAEFGEETCGHKPGRSSSPELTKCCRVLQFTWTAMHQCMHEWLTCNHSWGKFYSVLDIRCTCHRGTEAGFAYKGAKNWILTIEGGN